MGVSTLCPRWSQVWCGRENSSAVNGGNRYESTGVCRRGFVSRILTHTHSRERACVKQETEHEELYRSLETHTIATSPQPPSRILVDDQSMTMCAAGQTKHETVTQGRSGYGRLPTGPKKERKKEMGQAPSQHFVLESEILRL